MNFEITKGIIGGPVKVVLYGPEGIGKSTFANKFPGAVFIDTEGSTKHMDVARTPVPQRWEDFREIFQYFTEHPDDVGTLVIDTADWAEQLAIKKVCLDKKVESIEDIGYGKGYTMVGELFSKLLADLDILMCLGINIVVTAHAKMRKFEQPDEMGSYDRWEMKLTRQVAPMLKEWADMLLFVNYKTDVVKVKVDGKESMKAKGGKRVMYTTHHPCWDAKNRFGLEEVVPFEYEQIAKYIPTTHVVDPVKLEVKKAIKKEKENPTPAEPETKEVKKTSVKKNDDRPWWMNCDTDPEKDKCLKQLWEHMQLANVDTTDVQSVVALKGYYPANLPVRDYDVNFIRDVLIEAWMDVLASIKEMKGDIPF